MVFHLKASIKYHLPIFDNHNVFMLPSDLGKRNNHFAEEEDDGLKEVTDLRKIIQLLQEQKNRWFFQ